MIRVFTCFAGYGTDVFALKELGVEHELVGFSEIDKYAIQCFVQNHGGKNFGDITKINWSEVPDFDLLTGGFPCQSFSVAGKGLGHLDERGVLANYLTKALIEKQPKYFLFENVKGFMSKKHLEFREILFNDWRNAGYSIAYKILNTKDFGVPQNRERVWIIGIRKDIKRFGDFVFPEPFKLKLKLKDILESEVDEKYFLKQEQVDKIVNSSFVSRRDLLQKKDECSALRARDYKEPKCIKVGYLSETIVKRKFDTPKEINEFLRKYKLPNTNKEIADFIGVPLTQVEHYFRTDDSRAIPSKEIWFKLKELLKFDDSFDEIVCDTIEKENEFEMNQRVYSSDGLARTLTNSKETGLYALGCAVRAWPRTGSNDLNREQRLELNGREEANSITAVQKDSMVVFNLQPRSPNRPSVVKALAEGKPAPGGSGLLTKADGTTYCLDSNNSQAVGINDVHNCLTEAIGRQGSSKEFIKSCQSIGSVRRLTPRECFRLQGFLDDRVNLDGLSDTQKYKLAGNGQSVNVVKLLFKELLKEKEVKKQ